LSDVRTPDGLGPVDFDPFGLPLRLRPREVLAELIGASPGLMMVEGRLSAYVADYAGVCEVARDYEGFSSVKPPDVPGMNRFDFFNGQPVMNYSDPPEHTRRRRVINASFTRRRIEQLGAFINVDPADRHALYGLLARRAAPDDPGPDDPNPFSTDTRRTHAHRGQAIDRVAHDLLRPREG
jgi:cytochrome P450